MDKNCRERRPKAYLSPICTSIIHLRNPWVIALWSAAFPGFSQLALGKHLKGFILVLWEIVVNNQAHLNLLIIYTFTGRFQEAMEVANYRWLHLYVAVYAYSIWDGYRSTIELNKLALLTDGLPENMKPVNINSCGINYLDKRNPWVAAAWALLMPGLGHLYINRIISGVFVILWWIAISHFSHLMEVLQYSILGEYEKAVSIADWQWLLFMPSIHWFAIYDAYTATVEQNKLFVREQASYLKREYFHATAIDSFWQGR